MAQRVLTSLVDDMDGSEATETVTFGLDGKQYEIDLSEAHAADLRGSLAPYLRFARTVGRAGNTKGRGGVRTPADYNPGQVREWAAANGIEVNGRGRLPFEVIEKYKAAQG